MIAVQSSAVTRRARQQRRQSEALGLQRSRRNPRANEPVSHGPSAPLREVLVVAGVSRGVRVTGHIDVAFGALTDDVCHLAT
jgi:hypothetical protein